MSETKFKSTQGPMQLAGFFFEGTAVYFTHGGKEAILICPTQTELAHFFSRATASILDPKYVLPGFYGASKNLINLSITETKEEIWVVHGFAELACMCYAEDFCDKDGSIIAGPAVKKTKLECKLLLRGLGWDREVIDKLRISETPADVDIPF